MTYNLCVILHIAIFLILTALFIWKRFRPLETFFEKLFFIAIWGASTWSTFFIIYLKNKGLT